jgi:deazaflavin-dependent oxidoreductase (nitroreductase family)
MTMQTPPRAMLKRFSRINVLAYRVSGGKLMGRRNGLPLLLLTTTGRTSGKSHTVPLVFLQDGDCPLVMPGVYERPDWILNLETNPQATMQVGAETSAVRVESLTGADRDRIWQGVPDYWKDYQGQYDDPLPIMRLHSAS